MLYRQLKSVELFLRFNVVGKFKGLCLSVKKTEVCTVVPDNAGYAETVCSTE